MQILIYFFIGISLSMDAFSVAISIGTSSPNKKEKILISIIIGIFHYFMPLIGESIGNTISLEWIQRTNYITAFIFLLLAMEMIINRNKEETIKITSLFSIIGLAFAVSMDSLTVGLAFGITREKKILSSLIFAFTSAFFTRIGLSLGERLQKQFKKYSIYLGTALLLIVFLKYLFLG